MRRSLRFLLLIWVLPRCLSAQALAQRVGAVEERTGDARTPTVSKGPRAIDLFEEILRSLTAFAPDNTDQELSPHLYRGVLSE